MTEPVSGWAALTEAVKAVPDLFKEIYGDLAKPGASKAGMVLETIIDTGNTILLPFKLLNETSRVRFDNYMKSFKEKVEKIPEENLTRIPPEIGVPILDVLTYTTNEAIADLFINLLTTASSSNTIANAHPRFIEIIKSLSFDEAKIINYFNKQLNNNISYIPFITFRVICTNTKGYRDIHRRSNNVEDLANIEFVDNIDLYMNNFIALGILEIESENVYKALPDPSYDFLIETYKEHKEAISKITDLKKIEIKKGYNQITDFGQLFIQACSSKLPKE